MSQPPDKAMRVCFYLPVITPWWFENIVAPLIRTLAQKHEVHAVVTPMWKGTGLGVDQVPLIEALDHVQWHVLNGPDHWLLRKDASDNDELIAFVEAINPDLTLCRSADVKTPALFPGQVRFIMEGGAPPLQTCPSWVTLSSGVFKHGIMPVLLPDQEAELDAIADRLLTPLLSATWLPSREAVLIAAGLSPTARTIALPLEYEHEENFFRQQLSCPDNASLIREVADRTPSDTQILITNHPLNALYGDMSAVESVMAALGSKVGLLRQEAISSPPTLAAAQHCDAMVIENTKSWSACAAFGTPILRLSKLECADWLNAYRDWPSFLDTFSKGALCAPDAKLARRWFAFHMANDVFDPANPALTASDIIERAFVPVARTRWQAGIERVTSPTSEAA